MLQGRLVKIEGPRDKDKRMRSHIFHGRVGFKEGRDII